MTQVLLFGAAVVTMSMGIRHGFGLFLQPLTLDRGWSRETFAFAIAVQNLTWGLFGPLAGMVADRYGAFRVLFVGGLLYAGGLVLMALSTSGLAFTGSAGLMLGMAQAGTTYAIVFGVIARNVAPEKRSWAMGVAAAAGSFGQFLMLPVENWLIGGWGWQNALFVLGLMALIGLFNVFGTYIAGSVGQRISKPRILSAIYLLRSVAIIVFIGAPLTPWSVYLFAAAMGLLWLSTVPPTNAVVAQIFGVQSMSMLGGIVFLNHQIGSFLGAWLCGKLYESTGSYDIVWWISAALGLFAAAVNWPVRETPIMRPMPQPA